MQVHLCVGVSVYPCVYMHGCVRERGLEQCHLEVRADVHCIVSMASFVSVVCVPVHLCLVRQELRPTGVGHGQPGGLVRARARARSGAYHGPSIEAEGNGTRRHRHGELSYAQEWVE